MLTIRGSVKQHQRLRLGSCYNARTFKLGPTIFPAPQSDTINSNNVIYTLTSKLVRNYREARDFLNVSRGLSLRLRAGLLDVSGCLSYLRDKKTDSAEWLVYVKAQLATDAVRYEGVVPTAPPHLSHTMGTHFVHKINYGVDFMLCIKASSEAAQMKNDTALQMTITESSVVEVILMEIVTASLERDNMAAADWHERVTCYGTYNVQETLAKMADLASTISSFCRFVEQTDSAVVLEYELVPLSAAGLSTTAVRQTENSELHQLVDTFEAQFNDICRAVDLVETYRSQAAGQEMAARAIRLHGTLTRMKSRYMGTIADLDRMDLSDSGDWRETLGGCMEEYYRQAGDRTIMVVVRQHLSVFEENDYKVIDKKEWTALCAKKMPLSAIRQLDEERAVAIDDAVLRYTLPENVPRFDQFQVDEVRIVVVGRTGAGKSATANLLVGRQLAVFETGDKSTSVTHVVREEAFFYRGAKVRVMDTPGLFDTDRRAADVQFEIAKCITEFCDGVHVFILVRNGDGRYTREEQNAILELKTLFSSSLVSHAIVVLTRADAVLREKENLEQYLKENVNTPLGRLLLDDVNRRVMFVNNYASSAYEMRRQREALLGLIARLLEISDNKPYLQSAFEKAKSLRVNKQKQQFARTQQETALRDVARRAATAVAEDVATTFVNQASSTKCTEEAIASSVSKSLSSWRNNNPMGNVLGDRNIQAIAKTGARQALNRADSSDVIGATLTKHLRASVNRILQTGEHYTTPADQLSHVLCAVLPGDARKLLSAKRRPLLAGFVKQLVEDKQAHDCQLQAQAKLSRLISVEARFLIKNTSYKSLKRIGTSKRLRVKLLDNIVRRVKAGLTSSDLDLLSKDENTFNADLRKRTATQVKSEVAELTTVSCFEAIFEGSVTAIINAFSAVAKKGKDVVWGQSRAKNGKRADKNCCANK